MIQIDRWEADSEIEQRQHIIWHPNGPLLSCQWRTGSELATLKQRKKGLTISVASTRVPTIFSRTSVAFSIICADWILNMRRIMERYTWSSDAKDGGLEFGSNRSPGCMSYAKINVGRQVERIAYLSGHENRQWSTLSEESHLVSLVNASERVTSRTLLTLVTTPSITSPLKGLNTMAR